MSEARSVRRLLQFRVVDLLLLTACVAVVLVIVRPMAPQVSRARPWIAGEWSGVGRWHLHLYPDGYYAFAWPRNFVDGKGWKLVPSSNDDAFDLVCGENRFTVRGDEDSREIHALDADGKVQQRLLQHARFVGALRGGRPQGTWRAVYRRRPPSWFEFLKYDDGELVDVRDERGQRNLPLLYELRSRQGLPELTPRDASAEGGQ